MNPPRLDERINSLREQGIHSILTTFTDLHGVSKGKLVPLEALPDAVATGAGFAGPSIWGTGLPRMGARGEYFGRVVPESLRPLPFMPGVAHAVCDVRWLRRWRAAGDLLAAIAEAPVESIA